MKRIYLTDRTGRWFDSEKATGYKEESVWNGNNHISKATGSQFEHEMLLKTAGGRWVKNSWSNWQGTIETYELISEENARDWFYEQGYDFDSLPEEFKEGVAKCEI